MKKIDFSDIEIKDGFWKHYTNIVRDVTVYSVYDRFSETGRFDALKCDWKDGEANQPHVYWDSDIAKWIEGAAYLIQSYGEPKLEKIIDDMVELIEKNQRYDGYFNSYFLSVEPSKIYTDRDCHELYCTGHLIEAAIAYHKATGKDKLLSCMNKNVDYIYKIFIEEQSARFVTPGHEEIELALIKLHEYTGNTKALELARFFINQRGNNDKEEKAMNLQANIPVRDIHEAVGHAVRAVYLYTAMAMLANVDKDQELRNACERVLFNILQYKMSITGGIGSTNVGEAFSYDYDLPNTSVYNETCAAIGLAMFAGEMQQMEENSLYGDIIERVYFNGFISGLSLSGDRFFYTNPLEIDQKKYNRAGEYQPPFERVKVFECSCCPPNIVRMLASLPRYMYTVEHNTVYCNQFADSVTRLTIGEQEATLIQKTKYPLDGKIEFKYYGKPIKLCVRIPEWCVEYQGETENGFAKFDLVDGDTIIVDLPMEVHFIEANPYVQDNAGRFAVTRGPLVYCMEGIDNGDNLRDITLLENGNIEVRCEEGELAPVIYMEAERRKNTCPLYQIKNNNRLEFTAKLIPYFSFGNRAVTDMIVWSMVK